MNLRLIAAITLAMTASSVYTQQPSVTSLVRPELVLQTGVTAPVAIVAFSPDGQLLASMSFYGGSIKLWEVSSGRELYTISLGERSAITSAMNSAFGFTPDGSSVVSVGSGAIKHWDAKTGKLIRSLTINEGKDFGMAMLSLNCQRAATLTDSRQILKVWDATTGQQLQTQSYADRSRIHALALSADGRLVGTGEEQEEGTNEQRLLVVRDTGSWKAVQTIKLSETGKRGAPDNTQPMRTIRFSPDGRFVGMALKDQIYNVTASAANRNTSVGTGLRWWDVTSGREAHSAVVAPGGDPVGDFFIGAENTLAWSFDGKLCAVTGASREVKLFDTSSGQNTATVDAHEGSVLTLAFASDGSRLATTGIDRTIKIWDISGSNASRPQLVRTFGGTALPVSSVAYAADGRAITVAGSNAVNLWDLSSGSASRTMEIAPPTIKRPADLTEELTRSYLSAGGQLIASRTSDGSLKVWETRTGREVRSLTFDPEVRVGAGDLSFDGKLLAVPEGRDWKPSVMSGFPGSTISAAPAPPPSPLGTGATTGTGTGTAGATGGNDPKADAKREKENRKQMEKEARKQMEQMAKSGRGMGGFGGAGMSKDDIAKLQKMADEMQKAAASGDFGKMQEMSAQMMTGVSGGIGTLAGGAAGAAGATGTAASGSGARIRVLDTATQGAPREIQLPGSMMGAQNSVVAFSPDATRLAASNGGVTVRIFDLATGKELSSFTPPRAMQLTDLEFSPDGKMLAVSVMESKAGVTVDTIMSDSGFMTNFTYALRLFDVSDPKAPPRDLRALSGATASIDAIVFSPDSRFVTAGGLDSIVRVWEAATGREVAKLAGHALSINALDFSPDGKTLVSGSEDGSARLWDLTTGELLLTMVSVNRGSDWLAVTPDGLFDGTPGAWNQILWRFSANVFDVTPVEVFFNEFYSPGLVSMIHSGQRPRATKDVSQKDRRQPVVAITRVDGQSQTAEVSARTLAVRIDISEPAAGVGAQDVRLFRNGTLVKAWRGDVIKSAGKTSLEATLPVVAGENRITAYAFNRDNVKSVDAVLTLKGSASLKRAGTAHILAIGINRYANEQYNLKYAVADATSFGEEIRAQQLKLGQYAQAEVVLLADADATKEKILAAIAKLKSAQPEDAVIIYFAGHGTARGARFYLVPHDLGYTGPRGSVDAKAVETILERSISDLEIEAAVEGIDAERFLFVLDACNSGQALEAEEKRRGPMNSKGLAQLAYEKGMYILTAAQSYQAALEAAQLGHGYLTYALVEEGLKRGLADRDLKDGQVLAREWFNYATDRVPQMQEKEMKERLLLFVEGEEKIKDPSKRSVQRPRVFFRREMEATPMVVGRP